MGLWDTLKKIGEGAMSVANPIAAIASPIVSLIEGHENREAQREANERNAQENALNREFNSLEAAKQREFEAKQAQLANAFSSNEALKAFQRSSDFTREMWNKENEYNSPNAQIKRLVEAGINPNLFSGDNTAGSAGVVASSAPSASMPHGSSASASGSIPQSPLSYTNPLLESAQLRLANAQAKSLERETERKDDLHSVEVQTAQGNLRLVGLQGDYTEQQTLNLKQDLKLAAKRCEEIDQKISQSKEYERYMKLQGNALEEENKHIEERIMQELAIQTAKLQVEIENKKEIASRIVSNFSQANLNNQLNRESQGRLQGINNQNYLDGVKVQAVKDNRKRFLNLIYDNETSSLEMSTKQNLAETAKSEKEYRTNSMRNDMEGDMGNANLCLDLLEMLSTSVGAGFRIGLRLK